MKWMEIMPTVQGYINETSSFIFCSFDLTLSFTGSKRMSCVVVPIFLCECVLGVLQCKTWSFIKEKSKPENYFFNLFQPKTSELMPSDVKSDS